VGLQKSKLGCEKYFCMVTYILNTIGDALVQVIFFPLLPSFFMEERIILKTFTIVGTLLKGVEAIDRVTIVVVVVVVVLMLLFL